MLFSSDLCCNGLRCSLVIEINECVCLKNIWTWFFFFSDGLFIIASLCYHRVSILGMRYCFFFFFFVQLKDDQYHFFLPSPSIPLKTKQNLRSLNKSVFVFTFVLWNCLNPLGKAFLWQEGGGVVKKTPTEAKTSKPATRHHSVLLSEW